MVTIYDDNGLPRESTCQCFLAGASGQGKCTRSSYCPCAPNNAYSIHRGNGSSVSEAVTETMRHHCGNHVQAPLVGAYNWMWPPFTYYRNGSGVRSTLQGHGVNMSVVPPSNITIIVKGKKVPMPPPSDPVAAKLLRMGFRHGSPQFVESYIRRVEEDVPADAVKK